MHPLPIGFTNPLQALLNNSWKNGLAFWSIFALFAVPIWIVVLKHTQHLINKSSQKKTASLPFKNKEAWLLTAFVGLVILLFYCFTAWLPAIIEEKGYSPSFAGLIGTISMLAQLPATLLLPSLLKVISSRRLWITIFTLCEIIGLSILCFTNLNIGNNGYGKEPPSYRGSFITL